MPQYYNTSLKNLTNRLKRFREILDKELVDEMLSHENIIIDMVRDQLFSGVDGYTANIRPPYAPRTIKRKIKKGQPIDRVTLRDTGDFYGSLHLSYDDEGFYISSTDQKLSNILKSRYGKPILRLSNENLSELINKYIRPSLTEKLKDYIRNG